jgi:hypothetical protein
MNTVIGIDERYVGNSRVIVMYDGATYKCATISNDKIDQYNRNKQSDLIKLWHLAS